MLQDGRNNSAVRSCSLGKPSIFSEDSLLRRSPWTTEHSPLPAATTALQPILHPHGKPNTRHHPQAPRHGASPKHISALRDAPSRAVPQPLQTPGWKLSNSLPKATPGWITVRRGRRRQRQQRRRTGDARRGEQDGGVAAPELQPGSAAVRRSESISCNGASKGATHPKAGRAVTVFLFLKWANKTQE